MMRDVSEKEYVQHIKNIQTYGYTWVKDFIEPDTLQKLDELVHYHHNLVKDAEYAGRPERDKRDLRIYNLQNKDKLFIQILTTPFLRKVLIQLLNDSYYRFLPEDKPNYILQNFNARSSGNALELHIDSRIPGYRGKPWSMQVGFVLNQMTEENGCSIVVPGSHLSGRYTDRELDDVKSLYAGPGDLVMWDSRLWHGTKDNTDGSERWALFASFCMWWMKQDVNMAKSMPQEIYSQLTDEQKQLIGYCSLPPESEFDRINIKCGYDFLKPSVADYFN